MTRVQRTLLRILALGPSLALALVCSRAGESAPSTPEQGPPPDAQVSGDTASAEGGGESSQAKIRELIERMQEAYQAGLEAYQAGRYEEARKHFDRAVDLVISSDIDLDNYPSLKKAFDEIVKNIADMDADLYSREAEGKEDRSPLDELKDITTHLPPEDAEKERQKIQKLAGKIEYDLPIVLHPRVLSMVEAFQTRLREEFEAGLKRSGAYLPMIKNIFREEGLPEDLAYMAHQESAFKNNAYSRARAKGMWQFMSFTGRKYGLKRDLWVDERSDFEKATRAAAAYLKELHERYDDWYLAMAAYNAGEGRIDRAISRARTRDFWALTRTRYIRTETKYYVPAILASILIDKSPDDYGFDLDVDPELTWETVTLDKATDLQVIADAGGATLESIRFLNPELYGLITPPNVPSYTVRVPEGARRDVMAKLEEIPDDQRVSWTLHEVRPGETFVQIARKHSVPVRALLDANPRYAGRRLRRGMVLNVPLDGGTAQLALARASQEPEYERGARIVHQVRRGETLQEIAVMYQTTVANLKRWNALNGSLIHPGQRLIAYYRERGNGPHIDLPPPDAAVSVSGGRIEYRVQVGDTLSSIARKFNAAIEDLCRWNNLAPDSEPQPGDRLFVGEAPPGADSPGGEVSRQGPSEGAILHRVKRGETLHRIARLYDVSVQQVRLWNRLGGTSRIYPGQVLTIRRG